MTAPRRYPRAVSICPTYDPGMVRGRDTAPKRAHAQPGSTHAESAASPMVEAEGASQSVASIGVRDAVIAAVGLGSAVSSLIVLPIWGAAVTLAASAAMLAVLLPRVRRLLFACAVALTISAAAAAITEITRTADDGLRAAILEVRRQRDAAPFRAAILEYLNGERLTSGSQPLTQEDRMEEAAQAVARRDAITGTRDSGSIRAAILDMGWNRVGESLAAGRKWQEVPPDLVDEPRQHAVITSQEFTHVGIGVAFGRDNTIWIHAIVVG
jgi:uncharacterized protein YkwD